MVTKEDVFKLLSEVDIRKDDKVAVHSSLRAVGEIENGADGLIDALCEYLSEGLLFIPTHTWDNVTPDNPCYNVMETEPCIGVLPMVAAFRKDSVRSLHPTHSVAVFGKGGEDYIKCEKESKTPAPVGGWMTQFGNDGGKILLVGVGQNKNTFIHSAEERIDVPDRISHNCFDITVIDENGEASVIKGYRAHYTEALNGESCSIYYPNYEKPFAYLGALKYSKLANAKVTCCDAKKITKIVVEMWKKTDRDLCVSNDEIPEEYYENIKF